MKFTDLDLIWPIQKALVRKEFLEPTEIQQWIIPAILEKKDVLGLAQTWSGKTLAFILPILQNLYNKRAENGYTEWKIDRKITSLILAPTRELAIQIWEESKAFCTNTNIKHTVIYWGVNQFHQEKVINKWVDMLIATPGRLLDLVEQKIIDLSDVEIFTLDEADKMLNMGFIDDVYKILEYIPNRKQNLFFSATMPEKIESLAGKILSQPVKVEVHTNSSTVDTISQEIFCVEDELKPQLLIYTLQNNAFDSVIIFVKTKDRTEEVLEILQRENISCDHIHRNRSQNARQRAIKNLKNWEIQVLVATDILSRGIDVKDVTCVINYDLPQENETFVHRIGRTARAGKKWLALSFYVPAQKEKMSSIEELINTKIPENTNKDYVNLKLSTKRSLWNFEVTESYVSKKPRRKKR